MTHVTCRLTAKNRDQLRKSTLGSRVWATFAFFTFYMTMCLNIVRLSLLHLNVFQHYLLPVLFQFFQLQFQLKLLISSFLVTVKLQLLFFSFSYNYVIFQLGYFYRAMLCIRGTSHGPVSVCVCLSVCVCVCVCHKPVFY